ncbi:hypothetical protein GCM10022279_00420 [Comamonas faecalis]|uniref:Nitrogen fixation protein FixH n=1 Tax=Comamonas faecalis TaxID=1387849 RepID=A0ABP7QEC7_9BURK
MIANPSTAPGPMPGDAPARPWWKFGMVWMLIAGPAVVVVAGFVTLWLAVSRPDPVLSEDYYQRGLEINQTLRAQQEAEAAAMTPALKGRNHAATPREHRP